MKIEKCYEGARIKGWKRIRIHKEAGWISIVAVKARLTIPQFSIFQGCPSLKGATVSKN